MINECNHIWRVTFKYKLGCLNCGTTKPLKKCHCGKKGHALNSVNCPEHGYINIPKKNYDHYLGYIGNTPKPKLIKRTYRITPEQDKKIKKKSTKTISESEVIRKLIETL